MNDCASVLSKICESVRGEIAAHSAGALHVKEPVEKKMSQTKEGQRITPTLTPAPNYCKAASFHNKAGVEVKLLVYFDSGATEEHTMAKGSSVNVARTIDHGTWTTVDPIKRVEMAGPREEQNCEFDVKTLEHILNFIVLFQCGLLQHFI